jgi:hypothetical protein
MLNMMNLWHAIKSEDWILNETDAETPEDFEEDAMMLATVTSVIRSAPHYPEVGEA